MGEALRKILAKHRVLGVDTAVLIYHFEDVPPYSDFTEELFSAVARGEAELVIPALCAAEFLVKPWEGGEERAGEALRLLLGIPNARFVPLGVEEAAEAARLRSRYGLRMPDALVLAAAKGAGATALLTNDRRMGRVQEGLEVLVLDDLLPSGLQRK